MIALRFRILMTAGLLLLASTFGTARMAVAIPCAAGPVAGFLPSSVGIPPTPCTIGDKTYLFTNSSGNIDAHDVVLTPDTSNPLSPGFILSTNPPGGFFSATLGGHEQFGLGYSAQISDILSGVVITGTTVTANNYSIEVVIPGSTNESLSAISSSFLFGLGVCQVNATAGMVGNPSPHGTVTQDLGSPHSATLPGGCSALQVNALATIFVDSGSVDSSVIATLQSAGFYVNQARASSTGVPEPASLALMALGLLVIGLRGSRRS